MSLFNNKVKVKLYMKSGNVIEFECERATFTRQGNRITGYEIKGQNHDHIWIDFTEIESIFMDN
jgi:hypothetical protein